MPLVKYGGVLMKMRSPASRPSVSETCPALLETARSVCLHALGQARGAGREHDHRLLVLGDGLEPVRGDGRSGFAAGRAHAVHQTVRVRRHDEAHGTALGGRAGLVAGHDDHVRPRLADEPVDVRLRQAHVERDDHLAGEPRAEHAGEELVVLLEHQRDAGAAAAGGGQQGRRDPRRPRLHVRVGVHAAAGAQERLVRALGRPAAQARDGIGHQGLGRHRCLVRVVRSRRSGTR